MRCELVTGVQTCDLPILHDPDLPTVAVVTYRANVLAGNTLPVEQLCDAIEARGANARAVHCYSRRPGADGSEPPALEHLRGADVVVTTTWAAGGVVRDGDARGISTGDAWSSPLDALDVPVLQAVVATGPTAAWAERDAGPSPLDVTLGVAIPEFDGRIRSEEHTSELPSLMRISYAVFCLKKTTNH